MPDPNLYRPGGKRSLDYFDDTSTKPADLPQVRSGKVPEEFEHVEHGIVPLPTLASGAQQMPNIEHMGTMGWPMGKSTGVIALVFRGPQRDSASLVAASSPIVVPYNPYLVQQSVEVARADYSTGVMITMLIITIVPLVVAALAYFLIPRRPQPTPQIASAGVQETEQPGSAP